MATNLSPDQMKQFVRNHFEDFVNKRNAVVIRKNMTPDFYDHDGPGGKPTDLSGDEQMMVGMYKVMPDLHLTIEEMVAEGDKVMCRNTWRWTDASGKKMQFHRCATLATQQPEFRLKSRTMATIYKTPPYRLRVMPSTGSAPIHK